VDLKKFDQTLRKVGKPLLILAEFRTMARIVAQQNLIVQKLEQTIFV
jgi:hypothetical protein